MNKIIEALTILLKYGNPEHPFQCEHELLCIYGYNIETISKEDIEKLDSLGFFVSDTNRVQCFASYKYGSYW
jgi:hypothetical protein